MSKRTQTNRLNIEWGFAQRCWQELKLGNPVPEIPLYQTWEINESTGSKKLVKETPITPQKVTYNGVSYFGE